MAASVEHGTSLVTGVFEVLRLSKEGSGVVVVDFSSFPDVASSAPPFEIGGVNSGTLTAAEVSLESSFP